MTQSPEARFYTNYTGGYAGLLSRNLSSLDFLFEAGGRYRACDQYLRKLGSGSDARVVEIGCGNGDTLRWINHHYSPASLRGFDIALQGMVCDGSLTLQPANLNQPLPVEDHSVDMLIAMMVIEHLFDPFAAFSDVARCLSPNGRAFINLPLITSIKNRLRLLVGLMPQTSVSYSKWFAEGHWDGFHLHNFTLGSIKDLCASNGLLITRISTVGHWHSLKSLWPTMLANEISFELRHR